MICNIIEGYQEEKFEQSLKSFDIFIFPLSAQGTLSTGIPGEVRGYIVAWKAYGQLPWKQLVQPAIDKAKFGFIINKALYSVMKRQEGRLWKDPGLR